jgi:dihydroneopterin aldolase
MDKIFLRDLKTEAIIGIFDWERQVKQTVLIDLELSADVRKAAITDSIEDTLNYKRVAKRLLEYVDTTSFHLVETLAENIAMLVIEEFHVSWIRVTLNKPGAIRGSRSVGIVIEREKKDADDWRLRRGGK